LIRIKKNRSILLCALHSVNSNGNHYNINTNDSSCNFLPVSIFPEIRTLHWRQHSSRMWFERIETARLHKCRKEVNKKTIPSRKGGYWADRHLIKHVNDCWRLCDPERRARLQTQTSPSINNSTFLNRFTNFNNSEKTASFPRMVLVCALAPEWPLASAYVLCSGEGVILRVMGSITNIEVCSIFVNNDVVGHK
jgi:hypothetical protein